MVHPMSSSEITRGKPQLALGMDRWWWEAVGVACSVCGKLLSDFSLIAWCRELVPDPDAGSCAGHICLDGAQLLSGHSQGEETWPSLVQGLPFLFP